MIWSLICGKLLTKYGRRVLLVCGVVSMGLSMIAFGFINYSPNTIILTVVWLLIRTLQGISSSTILTTWYSIIAITYPDEQTKYLGFLEASSGAGMLFGPPFGSVLYNFLGFELTFYIIGGMFILFAPFLRIVIPNSVDIKDRQESLKIENLNENQYHMLIDEYNDINYTVTSAVDLGCKNKSTLIDNQNDQSQSISRSKVKYIALFSRKIFLMTSLSAFYAYFEYWYLEPILSLRLEDFNLTPIEIGLFFWSYAGMYTAASMIVFWFTKRFNNKGFIWICMLICGFINFMVGPSPFLPDSLIVMIIGQLLNGIFSNFFLITSLPLMIQDAVEGFPKQKIEVTDASSGVFTWMLSLGQSLGPIYGSHMVKLIGFRWWADTIAYMLIVFSLVYLIVWKWF